MSVREVIVTTLDGEVLASIVGDEVIQRNDVIVKLNNDDEPHEYVVREGKIYISKGGDSQMNSILRPSIIDK